MFFRLDQVLQDFSFRSGEMLECAVESVVPVRVVLRPPSKEELGIGHRESNTMCEAYAEFVPNSKTLAVFEAVENGTLRGSPEGFSMMYKDASGAEIYLPAKLPANLTDFFNRANKAMSDAIARVVHSLRWRTDAHGPHRVLSVRGMYWSRDAAWWSPARLSTSIYMQEMRYSRPVTAVERADIDALVQSDESAPLHHEMFREAWHQRLQNPRSAVVIGIASLEIAVKHCIGTLIPAALWLAENAPSPPVVKILTEYFPNLPMRHRLPGGSGALPESLIATLKKGVTIRNSLAHAGKFTPDQEAIDEILRSVKDVLWLVDYYCGQAWAYGHIREETRAAIEASSSATS
jgi:hypothetical protein